jgi:hypothetical protein
MVIEMLLDLGFRFSWDKCDLVPTQEFAYLGLLWDTRPGVFTCLLPPKKLQDLRQLARRLAHKRIVTPRMVSGLLGKLVACGAAAPSLAYTMRPLQLDLIRWMRFAPRRMWDCHVCFSRQARDALVELRVMLRHWNGRSLLPFVHTMEAYSDASDTGWGAHWTGGETQGNWTPEERALHITRRELLAVKFGLMALLDGLKGHRLLWRSDNTAVVSYINKMGGTKVPYMSKVALEIHRLADKHKISLQCLHIPGKENILADELSRRPLDRNDWKLNPRIFDMICAHWKARPTLDLFATRLNYQVKAFFSRYPDLYAKGTDAFLQSWAPTSSHLTKGIDLTLLWANLPWTLIGRVLQKVIHDRAEMILIAPVWPTQAWYPTLLELLVAKPLLLPNWDDLFLPVSTGNLTGKGPPRWAATAAWRLSGDPSRTAAFQGSLQTICSPGTTPPPPREESMIRIGVNGWSGPIGTKWIPLGRL